MSSRLSCQQTPPLPRSSAGPSFQPQPAGDGQTDAPTGPSLPLARLCYIFSSFVRACPFSGVIGFTAKGWMCVVGGWGGARAELATGVAQVGRKKEPGAEEEQGPPNLLLFSFSICSR